MNGMNNFGLISRMITDWAYPAGAIHRRLETRWKGSTAASVSIGIAGPGLLPRSRIDDRAGDLAG